MTELDTQVEITCATTSPPAMSPASSPITDTKNLSTDLAVLDIRQHSQTSDRQIWSKKWLDDVPLEIRQRVYRYYFLDAHMSITNSNWASMISGDQPNKNGKYSPVVYYTQTSKDKSSQQANCSQTRKALLYVSKQVNEEAKGTFFENSTFHIHTKSTFPNSIPQPPIRSVMWDEKSLVANPADIARLSKTTKDFACDKEFASIGIPLNFINPTEDIKQRGISVFAELLTNVKEIQVKDLVMCITRVKLFGTKVIPVYSEVVLRWTEHEGKRIPEISVNAGMIEEATELIHVSLRAMLSDGWNGCVIVLTKTYYSRREGSPTPVYNVQHTKETFDLDGIREEDRPSDISDASEDESQADDNQNDGDENANTAESEVGDEDGDSHESENEQDIDHR